MKILLEQMPRLNPCMLKIQSVFDKTYLNRTRKVCQILEMLIVLTILLLYLPCVNTFRMFIKQCVTTDTNKQNVKEWVNTDTLCHGNNILITPCMVQNAINKLTSGKTCDNNGLSTERYRKCILLPVFYNRVISHGHLVDDFLKKTIIIQLIQGPFIKQISLLQQM